MTGPFASWPSAAVRALLGWLPDRFRSSSPECSS